MESENCIFIIETNGILIGYDERYAEELSRFEFVHVRVSLKGCSESEFTWLTGAKPEGFLLQLKALENLINSKVKCHASVMASFSPNGSLTNLSRLKLRRELSENLRLKN